MQEARAVHLLQAVEQGPQDPVDLLRGEPAVPGNPVFERLAAQQLHDDVGRAVGFEEVEDMHDRRHAMQAGERAALGDEAIAPPAEIVGHLGRARQYGGAILPDSQRRRQVFLDRDLAIELNVARPVGDAEAALPQHRQDLVPADRLAGFQGDIVDIRRRRAGLVAGLTLDGVVHGGAGGG